MSPKQIRMGFRDGIFHDANFFVCRSKAELEAETFCFLCQKGLQDPLRPSRHRRILPTCRSEALARAKRDLARATPVIRNDSDLTRNLMVNKK